MPAADNFLRTHCQPSIAALQAARKPRVIYDLDQQGRVSVCFTWNVMLFIAVQPLLSAVASRLKPHGRCLETPFAEAKFEVSRPESRKHALTMHV